MQLAKILQNCGVPTFGGSVIGALRRSVAVPGLRTFEKEFTLDADARSGQGDRTGGRDVVDPVTALGVGASLVDITEKLGVLETLKKKLLKQPDVASAKLETALIELSKVYGVLDNSVNDYLGLWLLPDTENKNWRAEVSKLRGLASGRHEAEMRKAKGDCKKIWSIYVAYLQPWFSRALNKNEANQLFSLFRELSDIDSHMVDAIVDTSTWLTDEATATLMLVQAKKYEAADKRIQDAWKDWQPSAVVLRESMSRLYDLRADFIEAAGAL